MTETARSIPWKLAGLFAVLLGAAPALESAAGEAHKGHQTVGRYRGAPTHGTVSRPGPSASLRRLLPPAGLGSAANAPPGFYQRLSAPRPHFSAPPGHHHHPVPVYVPYPVYVEPPAYSAPPPEAALRYATAPAPQPQPHPQPQPIYIVQAPPAPAIAEPARSPAPAAPAAEPAPRSLEPVPVRFSIEPEEATVYLDDEPLGSALELAASELMLRPGVYVLEVFLSEELHQRLVFGVGSEAPIEVLVDLGDGRAGRRTRIR